MIIQGSLPGPAKRLIRFRDPTRPRKIPGEVEVTYVSTSSKQGECDILKTKAYNLVNSVEQEEMDAGLLAETYSVEAKDGKAVQLPDAFTSQIREDLVDQPFWRLEPTEAVLRSQRAQRKRSPQPGMKHSVEWWGKGRGVSRIMRKAGQKTGAQNPHTRGGRRAHGPKVEKEWSQKINSRERG